MPSANKIVDDLSRMMSGAAGVAQGARNEIENTMQSWTKRFVENQGYVREEEFQAVAEMAKKARAENAELRKELDALAAEVKSLKKAKK